MSPAPWGETSHFAAVVTGSTCLHVPAGYAGISRWRHNMPAVVCRAGFRFVCRAFSPARCHFQHSSVEIDACIRQDRQAKMHSDPDRDDFLLIMRYCFALCRGLISPNTYLCILSRSVARVSGIVARFGSGHSGYADRMRAHPSRCKQTRKTQKRHIPMYRPVHSAHTNKCSLRYTCALLLDCR